MTSEPHSVHVLLASYNGAEHLPLQLESIRAQTDHRWRLLVRDDGSSDQTGMVLERFAVREKRMEILRDAERQLGAAGNFARLATAALDRGARYVMFADQDDVWFPDKIERTLKLMERSEREQGPETPVLIHSDLEVIDERGRLLHPSFMRLQRINHRLQPSSNALRTLLVQNVVTGCTAMANRALLFVALPMPEVTLMHDWWLALCAASWGTVAYVPDATVGYRRHGTNVMTVRGFWRTMNPLMTNWRQVWGAGTHGYLQTVRQAEALLDRLKNRPPASDAAIRLVQAFVDLHGPGLSGPSRFRRALALGLRSQTWARTATLYLRVVRYGQGSG